jgi:hypothetical protein
MADIIMPDGSSAKIPDFVLESTAQSLLKTLNLLNKTSEKSFKELIDYAKDSAKDSEKYRKDFESDREDLYKATLDIAKAVREKSKSGNTPDITSQLNPQLSRLSNSANNTANNINNISDASVQGAESLEGLGATADAASEQMDRYNRATARGEKAMVFLYTNVSKGAVAFVSAVTLTAVAITKEFTGLGEQLNELTKVGVGFGDSVDQGGMLASEAMISLYQNGLDASNVLKSYSSVVQSLGKRSFTGLVNSFMDATNSGADLGMSLEDSADRLGRELQKRQLLGVLADADNAKVQKQVITTIKRQQAYATALGVSTEHLEEFTDALLQRTPVLSASLLRFSSDVRGKLTAGITDFGTAMRAMGGEEGGQIAMAFTEAAASGAMGFSDAMTGYVTALPSLAGPMNQYIRHIRDGTLTQDDANQMAQDLAKQLGNVSASERNRIFALARAGDAQAESMAKAIMQFEQSERKIADINKQLGTGFTMEGVQKGTNVLTNIMKVLSGTFESFKVAFLSGLGNTGPNMEGLSKALTEARDTIFAAFGKVAEKFGFANKSLGGFADGAKSLGQQLGERLPKIINTVATKIAKFIVMLPEIISNLKSFFTGVYDTIRVVTTLLSPFVAVIKFLTSVIGGAVSVLAPVFKVLGAAIEALVAVITWPIKALTNLFGDAGTETFNFARSLGQLTGIVAVAYGAMKLFGLGIPKLLVNMGSVLKTGAGKAVDTLGSLFKNKFPALSKNISSAVGGVIDRIRGTSSTQGQPNPATIPGADQAAETTASSIADIIKSAGETIKTVLTDLSAGVKNLITNLADGVRNAIRALSKSIADVGQGIGKAVGGLIQGTLTGVGKGLAALGNPQALLGTVTLAALAGTMYLAAKSFQQFAEVSWSDIGKGFVSLLGLGAVAAVLGLALPLIIPGAIAIGALGLALIPFAAAAAIAGPAMVELSAGLNNLNTVDPVKLALLGPALLSLTAGMAALSAGGLISNLLDGLGSLFGGDSPFEKLTQISEAAPGIALLSDKMSAFGDVVNSFNEALSQLDGSAIAAELSLISNSMDSLNSAAPKANSGGLLDRIKSVFSNTAPENEIAALADLTTPSSLATFQYGGGAEYDLDKLKQVAEQAASVYTDTSEITSAIVDEMYAQAEKQGTAPRLEISDQIRTLVDAGKFTNTGMFSNLSNTQANASELISTATTKPVTGSAVVPVSEFNQRPIVQPQTLQPFAAAQPLSPVSTPVSTAVSATESNTASTQTAQQPAATQRQPITTQTKEDLLEEILKEQRITNKLLKRNNANTRDMIDVL